MTYKRLKLKLRVFLAGHIVAMVTYCATKLTATYSPMIGQFVDTMVLASTDKDVVLMIHQTVSLGKYCKLFPSTLSDLSLSEFPLVRRVKATYSILKSLLLEAKKKETLRARLLPQFLHRIIVQG